MLVPVIAALLLHVSADPMPMSGHAGVQIGEKVFIFGGGAINNIGRYFSESWVVDLMRRTCVPAPPSHTERAMAAAAAIGDDVYVAGGLKWTDVPLRLVERFNVKTQEWSEVAPLNVARSRLSMVALNGELYVVSGMSGAGSELNTPTIEEYSPAENKWQIVGRLHHARHGFACVVDHGKIYVYGGNDNDSARSAEVFDPETKVSKELPNMPHPRGFGGAISLSGLILCFGGRGASQFMDAFDPSSETWTTSTIKDVDMNRFVFAKMAGKLWIIGGENGKGKDFVKSFSLAG